MTYYLNPNIEGCLLPFVAAGLLITRQSATHGLYDLHFLFFSMILGKILPLLLN